MYWFFLELNRCWIVLYLDHLPWPLHCVATWRHFSKTECINNKFITITDTIICFNINMNVDQYIIEIISLPLWFLFQWLSHKMRSKFWFYWRTNPSQYHFHKTGHNPIILEKKWLSVKLSQLWFLKVGKI